MHDDYDGGCGDPDCELCQKYREERLMKMNDNPEWLKKMSELEDGCDVSVGGMDHAELLRRLSAPGEEPPEQDAAAKPKEPTDGK